MNDPNERSYFVFHIALKRNDYAFFSILYSHSRHSFDLCVHFHVTSTGRDLCLTHAVIRAVAGEHIQADVREGQYPPPCDDCTEKEEKEGQELLVRVDRVLNPFQCPTCKATIKQAKINPSTLEECQDIWHRTY